jgi:ribonuclease HI
MAVRVYVDSSYDEKKKIAGYGIYVLDGVKEKSYSNFIPAPSNNYGELWAIYQAAILTSGKRDVVIYTDSQTALQYINRQIKEKERYFDKYIIHKQMELLAYKIRRLNPTCEKIKGHVSHFQKHCTAQNIADLLAKRGRSKYYEDF